MNKIKFIFLSVFLIIALVSCKKEEVFNHELAAPTTKKVLTKRIVLGDTLIDNYAWLQKKENKEVIDYLTSENKYTEDILKPTEKFQEKLYKEILSRIEENDLSVPFKRGNYFYYSKTLEGKQYPIYCRKENSLDNSEEIILDLNTLAKDKDYCGLGIFTLSEDQNLLAYSLDFDGSETYRLYVKNLQTGEILADSIDVIEDLTWDNEGEAFLYTISNDANRSYKVLYHKLGTPVSEDKTLYEEKDDSFYVYTYKTRSKKFMFIGTGNKTTSENYFMNIDSLENGELMLFSKREKDVETYIEHSDGKFYITTNKNAKNFKLMISDENTYSEENWQEFIGHREDVTLDGLHIFKNYFVIEELKNGLKDFRIINRKTNNEYYITFPEEVYSASSTKNISYDTDYFRFGYSSFITPPKVIDYNLSNKEETILKENKVLGEFHPEKYVVKREWAESYDGVKVPLSIVHLKNIKQNAKNPVYIYTYGSYGDVEEAYFSSSRLSLLDRGVVFAIAHIRGGGELGVKWHDAGKLLNRRNTFEDLAACAKFFIKENYTTKGNIIIEGGSAGGMVMGATVDMYPDLFKAVIADVPFVDVLNTMLDPDLPLTVLEYEEWGNPTEQKYFDYIKSYCPYQNVKAQAYPNMLILGGLNDPRVSYWEPAKFAAKIREMNTNNSIILLKTNMGAGHGGASGWYDWYKELAFNYAYILVNFGIYN